ncbi:iron uptake transporter deferrochelatase/peroxidase subunit [Streptomyces sp. H10-C2]|uniref:iron uptake transporter deferrochelatase/peroxidase subunit n=1 Tax=unclassified Streptomyces TaxID=2593676 RepID=UPI0024B997B9|nr:MULTISPECIES: iron uptake transporter deferrochelatase/peroxidase subunit [unclassified Streptomyces]MDJ0342074.1 iron uptake transporter deferrochelatase/peroxidase subunit [Streptomyces sp. PH10-H1]MDJ0368416.1 iron uptake transporter deferrochelatase/peroxidase subunit [Streptomyces sp. H10-C2]
MTEQRTPEQRAPEQRTAGTRAAEPHPTGPQTTEKAPAGRHLTRRRLLGTAGAGAGLVVGGAGGALGTTALRDEPTAPASIGATGVGFRDGTHQAGITTPQQACGHLVAFDLAPGQGRGNAAALLSRWTSAAQDMINGRLVTNDDQIAYDAGPSSLTITFGFGRSLFTKTGLEAQAPAALAPLPAFSADALDPARSNGDLWVQIGANDALVAFHALRVLHKTAGNAARVRWQMNGFNRTPGATPEPMTSRNLMGQVDGTNNPKPTDADFDQRIFVPAGGTARSPQWMHGGSYAVVRRIRMLLDSWDHLSRDQQEKVIGRRKSNGSPLSDGSQTSDGSETTPVDLDKRNAQGAPAIAGDAHIRVAAPASNSGAAMLRRPFSYHDGIGADGTPDAGLLFVCWQADPQRGFIPVQRKLDRGDGLSRFLRHESSALFAVPGAPGPGEYVGQRLLEW